MIGKTEAGTPIVKTSGLRKVFKTRGGTVEVVAILAVVAVVIAARSFSTAAA
ncbi:MAG TPA: hypothetical protein VIJ28_16750 [Chloroflexota bacterium]|jgi:hypothetical protein